ncbi:MAG: acetolactate synthase large subunit, partial [Bacteroidaceae bacterium]|nr:acetolactate synthase large subunit [Bacteroidaceae bacterium]
MTNEKISGAEALMRSLEHEGVEVLFGYPGGAIMPTYDALYDHKETLHHILVRHEQAAVHAAQGYARVSGKVGCAIVTSGPGAMNTITGVADAMIDSTPMVVICGQVGAAMLGTDAFQEVDVVGVTQPITKWNYQIRRAEDIPWAVARAFYIAKSGRPGPVVLDFAKNAQTAMIEYAPQKVDFIRSYNPYPLPEEGAYETAARMINNSVKPFMLVGQGVELAGANEELIALCEKAQIPFASTILGLSAAPSEHSLNMGMLGMHGNLAPNTMTNQCDLLIAVGMRFDDRVTGNLKAYAKQAKVIHFEIDPSELGKNVKPTLSVLGDCKQTLPEVTKLVEKATHKAWIEGFKPYAEKEYTKVIDAALNPTEGPLLMGEVVRKVSEAANNEAILVTDVG